MNRLMRCCFQPLRHFVPPPLYFAVQNTEEEGEMYSPFASSSILYTTPRKAAGHGRGGVLKYPFDSGTWILILRVDFLIFFGVQGRRIATQPFSLCCFVAPCNATGYGRGGGWDLILLLPLFFQPLRHCVPPPLYFCVAKTQRRRVSCSLLPCRVL